MSEISESLTLALVSPVTLSCKAPGTILKEDKLTPLSILASLISEKGRFSVLIDPKAIRSELLILPSVKWSELKILLLILAASIVSDTIAPLMTASFLI